MGFKDKVAAGIRSIFKQDKTRAAAGLARGALVPPGMPGGLLGSFGNDHMGEYARLDQDILARYADYNEMDDYGELSVALDMYADDASQTDSQTNRVLWVTSKDENLKMVLDDLFHRTLRMDEDAWEIIRSTCKYGNDFEEILVTEEGVRGLNHLPAPTVRRIEGPRGDLMGFVQDFGGRTGITPTQFKELLRKRLSNESKEQPEDSEEAARTEDDTVALEDWEVVHFRLRGKQRRSIYGHCLSGNSRVWTLSGLIPIKNVKIGDRVWMRHAGQVRSAKVKNKVCSGHKDVFTLKTARRQIVATAAHPFLVYKGGKNNAWVPLDKLCVGDKILAANLMPESTPPPPLGVSLTEVTEDSFVRLTERGVAALRRCERNTKFTPKGSGLRHVFRGLITRSVLEELLEGKSSVPLSTLRKMFAAVGTPLFEGSFCLETDPRLALPDFVDLDFCRLLGFMTGDGWITDGGAVCFARGMDEELNKYYEGMLHKLGLGAYFYNGLSQAVAHSKNLVALFRKLGWIDGAHYKRVPQWMFTIGEEYRRAFLEGLMDADGHAEGNSLRLELCNKALVGDVKALIDGLGWQCGNVHERYRESRTLYAGTPMALWPGRVVEKDRVFPAGWAYYIYWSKTDVRVDDSGAVPDTIESIEPAGSEDVYDIEIDDNGHNFIADGLYVHNSVFDSARWIWRRLVMLEDSALIYRLQRAPERFAFYTDVGDLPPQEALAYLNKIRQSHKKKKFIDPSTGKLSLRYEPLSPNEDFYIPVRKGQEGARIEVLGAPAWQDMQDVEFFQKKLYAAIKIPKAYLGDSEGVVRATLSQQDVRFARTILRVQRAFIDGCRTIARVHLSALGIDPYDTEYEIWMTVPSSIFELAQLEVRNAKADLASRMGSYVSLHYLLSKVFGMSDDEIECVMVERGDDLKRDAIYQAKAQEAATAAVPPAPIIGGDGQPLPNQDASGNPVEPPQAQPAGPQLPEGYRPLHLRNRLSIPSRNGINEKELLQDHHRMDPRTDAKLEKLLRSDDALRARLENISGMLREIHAIARNRR